MKKIRHSLTLELTGYTSYCITCTDALPIIAECRHKQFFSNAFTHAKDLWIFCIRRPNNKFYELSRGLRATVCSFSALLSSA